MGYNFDNLLIDRGFELGLSVAHCLAELLDAEKQARSLSRHPIISVTVENDGHNGLVRFAEHGNGRYVWATVGGLASTEKSGIHQVIELRMAFQREGTPEPKSSKEATVVIAVENNDWNLAALKTLRWLTRSADETDMNP